MPEQSVIEKEYAPIKNLELRTGRLLMDLAAALPLKLGRLLMGQVLKRAILRGRRLVPEKELESKFVEALGLLNEQGQSLGDYLEFGVYNGTSMACMYRAIKETDTQSMRLIGFDSFEGLAPDVQLEDDGVWKPGQYSCPRSVTEWFLQREQVDPSHVQLVEGWFVDSLNKATAKRLKLKKASVIMIDSDNYSSARQALQFSSPFIQDQCVLFFDDWHSHELDKKGMGEKRAFDEFLKTRQDLEVEPYGAYNTLSKVFILRACLKKFTKGVAKALGTLTMLVQEGLPYLICGIG